jgi:hypothetical protein
MRFQTRADRRKAFRAPDRKAKPDKRVPGPGRAEQPPAECPVCGAMIKQKKAQDVEAGEYAVSPGTRKGDLILSNHRPGGGAVNLRGGDLPCLGSKSVGKVRR